MTYYQTALYKGKWKNQKYGWDYGSLIFESSVHHNPTFVMHQFNNYSHTEDKWIGTMRIFEGDEIVLEEIFDSTVLGMDKFLTITFKNFSLLLEFEKTYVAERYGVLISERMDREFQYKLYQIQSFYVELSYNKGHNSYKSIKFSKDTDLLDPYLHGIRLDL